MLQTLYNRYHYCMKKNRKLDKYTEEFLRLQSKCNNCENKDQKVAHYQRGLSREIRYIIGVSTIYTLVDAIQMAKWAEEQLEWENKQQTKRNSNYRWLGSIGKSYNNSIKASKTSETRKNGLIEEEKNDTREKRPVKANEKIDELNPYRKHYGDIHYLCKQPGHQSDKCLELDYQQFHVVDEVEEEEFESDDGKSITSDANEEVTFVIKKLICSLKQKDDTQRRRIFQVKCKVGDTVYRLIIDSCSCENFIAKQLV